MKDQIARNEADYARIVANNASDRSKEAADGVYGLTRLAAEQNDVIHILAREQARLRAAQDADLIVDDLVYAAQQAVLAQHDQRVAKLEARVDALTEQLAAALPAEPYAPEAIDNEDRLDDAIASERVVEFVYEDREGVQSLRLVSPYDLIDAANGAKLLVAYDHDRGGIRQFRIERIESVEALHAMDARYREPQV